MSVTVADILTQVDRATAPDGGQRSVFSTSPASLRMTALRFEDTCVSVRLDVDRILLQAGRDAVGHRRDRALQIVGVVAQRRADVRRGGRHRALDLARVALERAADDLRHGGQRMLNLVGVLLERVRHAGRSGRERRARPRSCPASSTLLTRADVATRMRSDLRRLLLQRAGDRGRSADQRALGLVRSSASCRR